MNIIKKVDLYLGTKRTLSRRKRGALILISYVQLAILFFLPIEYSIPAWIRQCAIACSAGIIVLIGCMFNAYLTLSIILVLAGVILPPEYDMAVPAIVLGVLCFFLGLLCLFRFFKWKHVNKKREKEGPAQ